MQDDSFFTAMPWEIEEALNGDEEKLERQREWKSLSARKKLRWIVGFPSRLVQYLWGKIAWRLWRKRALLRRLDTEKKRMMQLAGIRAVAPSIPSLLPNHSPAMESYDWSARHVLHKEALQKISPPPLPPVVTDRVAIDYHVIFGDPYLIDQNGQRMVTKAPKPRRRSSSAKKKRSRGKSHR